MPICTFPQYRMIAAYGKDLLDWLNRYTFIEEQRFADPAVAKPAASLFLDELARNGITSCLAFSTIHPVALDALFEEAQSRNMAIASGKTLMDCHAPAGLCDTPQSAYDDSTALIKRWHGKGRVKYAYQSTFRRHIVRGATGGRRNPRQGKSRPSGSNPSVGKPWRDRICCQPLSQSKRLHRCL